MKLKVYATWMTGFVAFGAACAVGWAFTAADVLEVVFGGMLIGATAACACGLIIAAAEEDAQENLRLRVARQARQRMRKDMPIIDIDMEWPMYDDQGRRVQEITRWQKLQ